MTGQAIVGYVILVGSAEASNELREDEAEATLKALKAESPETFRRAVATPEAGAKALRDNAVALLAGLRYRVAQRRVVWEVLM